MKNHISFTEFSIFNQCPYKHKLLYVDEVIPFEENEHLSFGKAMHSVAENQVNENNSISDYKEFFELNFLKGLLELKQKFPEQELDISLIAEMRQQGKVLSENLILPELRKIYGNFNVVKTEENLYENICSSQLLREYNFKGFIDLIIQTSDGKFVLIDYKTSSSGWWGKERNDKMKIYQLMFYKYFWAKKHNISLDNINTAFVLLKRKIKKNPIEVYSVTSGNKRITNALDLLIKTVNGIISGKGWKNRKSCLPYCKLIDTEICPSVPK